VKRGDLLRHLRKHGCHLKREGRSYSLWTNPVTGAIEAIPRHTEISDICHQQSLASDVVLNLTYKDVMQGLRPTDQKHLREEQRFWLKERDPQCQVATVSMSNEPLGFLRCVISATDIRTIRLREWKRH
jgi:mRNA interferase HicA